MAFYTPQIPQYHSSDNSSPLLNIPSPLPSGSYQFLSSAGPDCSSRQSEELNDSSSALFKASND
jgi:hypothetical protein